MRQKNEELPNMPGADEVGTVAQRFRTAIEKIEAAKAERGEAESALLKALENAKRDSIQIDGYTFEIQETAAKTSIKVGKPKVK